MPVDVSVFVTVTFTAPAACAGVTAVIFVALTTTTLVAAVVPNFRVAPLWKPVPLTVTAVWPLIEPLFGETEVTVTGGVATVTFALLVSAQDAAVVTVTCSFSVPSPPAVKVMLFVPVPAVMVPFVTDQL